LASAEKRTFIQDSDPLRRYFRAMTTEIRLEGSDDPLAARDKARFWRDPHFNGLECLSATFHTLEFAPHSHETYCIGVMEAGIQRSRIRGASHHAGAGDLYLINPEVIHEGRPAEKGYRYRMIYPSAGLLTGLLEDATAGSIHGIPAFPDLTTAAPGLAAEFLRVHRQMENGNFRLETQTRFYTLMIALMNIFGQQNVSTAPLKEKKAVRMAREFLEAHFREDVSLEDVSLACGLSRAHLIRAFRTEFHMPPHAWMIDRRIREARTRLRDGASISGTAFECGFSDQAHLTRLFKARTGVTPAAYRDQRLN
jgi:AraC-like DNA-binding protein